MKGLDESAVLSARALLSRARRVAVLTGAGISAESGLPTFRGAGGLWDGFNSQELASPQGWAMEPAKVWRWHNQLRLALRRARPNAAHRALARLQQRAAGWESFRLATQNIDALHQRASSTGVLELHGSLLRVQCNGCRTQRDLDLYCDCDDPPTCSRCAWPMRPAVVWFGEQLPTAMWEAAFEAARSCDVLLSVGTSAAVYPVAGLIELAARAGAKVIEVNLEPTPMTATAELSLWGPAGRVLPRLLE
jgi:NAD-dependent deacetylase